MTREERRAIEAVTDRPLRWAFHENPRFVHLVARPCPLVDFDASGQSACSVYAFRPMNCRRYGCFRASPRTEPFPVDGVPVLLRHRPELLAQARAMQAEAQVWGTQHGWKETDR